MTGEQERNVKELRPVTVDNEWDGRKKEEEKSVQALRCPVWAPRGCQCPSWSRTQRRR